MIKPKRKVVNLSEEVYQRLKEHCKNNGLKIIWVLEKLINEYIKNESNKIK